MFNAPVEMATGYELPVLGTCALGFACLVVSNWLRFGFCTSVCVAVLLGEGLLACSCSSIALLFRADRSSTVPLVSLVTCRSVSNAASRVLIFPFILTRMFLKSSFLSAVVRSNDQCSDPDWGLRSCLLRRHANRVHRLLTRHNSRRCSSQDLHLCNCTAVASFRRNRIFSSLNRVSDSSSGGPR